MAYVYRDIAKEAEKHKKELPITWVLFAIVIIFVVARVAVTEIF